MKNFNFVRSFSFGGLSSFFRNGIFLLALLSAVGVVSLSPWAAASAWAQNTSAPPMQGTTGAPAAPTTQSVGQATQQSGALPAAAVATPPQPSFVGALFPMVMILGVFYFLIIRPQQKKMKQQQEMLGSLKDGDEVVTTSGILGQIRGMTESVVTLEIADQVKIKILRSQIAQVVKGSVKEVAQSFARPGAQ